MDSPEGSANDAMTAEINRRVNEAVNASIRPLQDQMMQLLTALNGLMSTDRATPTPLTSSDDYHRWLLKVQDFAIKLESLPQQAHKDGDMAISGVSRAKGKERARLRRQRSSSSSSEDLQQPKKDSRYCYNCNQIGHIAIWCPRRKPLSPTKAKKVKKVKKDPKPEGSSTQADALVDTRCDLYALIDHNLARKLRLLIVDRSERVLGSFSDITGATKATGVVIFNLKLCGYDEKIFAAAKWFTKLDVVAAFHKIQIAEGEEYKTAFRTRYRLFEWLIVPFGLTGAPATFQRYINSVLREYLDDFATAYTDNVLIYSNSLRQDHEAKVKLVLRKLAAAGLHLDPHKCAFSVKTVKYLGFIITAGAAPRTVKGVRSFLGFANYYRIFIPAYSEIAGPLIALTKKGVLFCWGKEQEAAFQELKRIFAAKPVLHQLNPKRTTYVEADCSGFALRGVLSQEDEHRRRHAVAYHSQRLNAAQFNYPIHNKEMLAIMSCLQE
ncbi:Transposon Tf2-8 polyprotein [Colletotrichum aenigma]|uniref:Transposon Tf2-8 polyprotein n=1 Tax=Colletotrichum aenigma TaxID=1215731 RepID=UPI0018729AF5|nr:Transposon Tf2-8 polyprotein [Colletotrichum aenigma]KAF5507206.1 Transposon Tf2-8 polyprotein [Colletotrichum aenigma]